MNISATDGIQAKGGAKKRRPRNLRRAVLSVELVLTLPILLTVVLAMTQFAILLMSTQTISAAANVGAREASLPSATVASTTAAVQRAVAGWQFAGSADLTVNVQARDGDTGVAKNLADAVTGDVVLVQVKVPSIEAAPNLLKFIGLSIEDQWLQSTTVVRKE